MTHHVGQMNRGGSMSRGGPTNINGAPVDEMAPNYPQKSTKDLIDKAMDIPAFAKKYGKLMADRFSFVATQEANKAASRAASAPRAPISLDGNFKPKGFEKDDPDSSIPRSYTSPTGLIIGAEHNKTPEEHAEEIAATKAAAAAKEASVQEKKDENHEAAMATNPTTTSEAMIAAALTGAQVSTVVAEVGAAAQDAGTLLPKLAKALDALFTAIKRRDNLKPTVKAKGMDAATRRVAMDAAKASDKEWLAAEGYMSDAGVEVPYRWYWDASLNLPRPRRG
jgi:hypothetical protein